MCKHIAQNLGDFELNFQKVRENSLKTNNVWSFYIAQNLGDFTTYSQKVRENAPKTYHA